MISARPRSTRAAANQKSEFQGNESAKQTTTVPSALPEKNEKKSVATEKSPVVAEKSPVVAEKSPVEAEKSPAVAEKVVATAETPSVEVTVDSPGVNEKVKCTRSI